MIRKPVFARSLPAQPSAAAAIWDRPEALKKSELQSAHIHPDPTLEKRVHGTRPFPDLLLPRLDLGGGVIGLRDMQSTGCLFEVLPIASEARQPAHFEAVHEKILNALVNVFPERSLNPWIAQFFVYDEPALASFAGDIEKYVDRNSRGGEYASAWLKHLDEHFEDASRETGFFPASQARETHWRARRRRVKLCIWRGQLPGEPLDPTDNLEHIAEKLTSAVQQADVRLRRLEASDLYEWLTQWFTPVPEEYTAARDTSRLLRQNPWTPELASADISRSALNGAAPSTTPGGLWWFRGRPSRFITIDEPTRVPEIGHFTAERPLGDTKSALWDKMPPGSTLSVTIVFAVQDAVADHIKRIRHNSIGADPEALGRRDLATEALESMASPRPIYRVFAGVYASAPNGDALKRSTSRILAVLSANGLKPVPPQYDPIAQDSYIRALPFGFDPQQDQRWYARRARLWHADHVARLAPFLGRSIGTGHPGAVFFNRGAEPLVFDPLNPADRRKNAHALILGPTGSGKTSMLIYMLLHTMAIHRPRLFLITALPTFGLFTDYCRSLGLTVARRSITAAGEVKLPPFANAPSLAADLAAENADDDPEASIRDLLGEMEIQARLMITGGNPADEAAIRRDDLDLIRSAIIQAGRSTAPGEQTMTHDLVAALNEAAQGRLGEMPVSGARRETAGRMAGAMNLFCTGVNGKIFDQPGDPWPTADVTVVELGLFARRGYEDRLAVALTGLMGSIQNVVEEEQYADRQTIVVIDEAHVLLQNPLVSPYLARIVSTWRTFGAWLWIATQNLRQFPDAAKELLDQPEWWIALAVDEDEVDQIARFRTLTDEQRSMIKSAEKVPGCYTEGTVMSGTLLNLFRNIPPSIALALAQTEKHEKAQREKLRKQLGISELEAALHIARQIRDDRRNG